MKRLTFKLFISGAALIFITANSYAQRDLAYNHKNDHASANNNAVSGPGETELKASHPKLLDNFGKTFPGATNATWSTLNSSHQVTFMYSGKKTRAVFTEQEELSYSISEFQPKDLPAGIAQLINTNYTGYTVFSALEVKSNKACCYNMVLENSTGYINVKIAGDEIEEVSRTTKTK